ncbi:MAG: Tetratricopeptide 2 [Bradyrhizobium sp.]|nr:Tetratricopeptide 2 [Bradyrhizobium sp.]
MKRAAAVFILVLALLSPAIAETVEIAPGVRVTKKTFAAPVNEQPFYGFIEKTPEMRAVDDKFVQAVTGKMTSEAASREASQRGWRAISAGKLDEAGRRFNQAFLLDPQQSGVYHGWAVVVFERFKDTEFANELFNVAKKQRNPGENLNADHGRFLLVTKRTGEALPVLEQAVKDAPKFGDAWSNLAFARLYAGDRAGACTAAAVATGLMPSANIRTDLEALRAQAKCS